MDKSAVSYQGVSLSYDEGITWALKDFSATIPQGKITAIIGHTGSGKSSLMNLTDGLLLPTEGELVVMGHQLTAATKQTALNELRHSIGFVFQFPEHQLFADTVLADVMFGPLNLGLSLQKAKAAAQTALSELGIGRPFYERSPFELSGGQQRRVAIAGVLAMKPKLLILDEPTAGLDPDGQQELLALIKKLKRAGLTILLVTHQMEQVAELADQVLVLATGKLVFSGRPRELFADPLLLAKHHLVEPQAVTFAHQLTETYPELFDHFPITLTELADALAEKLRGLNHE